MAEYFGKHQKTRQVHHRVEWGGGVRTRFRPNVGDAVRSAGRCTGSNCFRRHPPLAPASPAPVTFGIDSGSEPARKKGRDWECA
jgi:hypothetical protein